MKAWLFFYLKCVIASEFQKHERYIVKNFLQPSPATQVPSPRSTNLFCFTHALLEICYLFLYKRTSPLPSLSPFLFPFTFIVFYCIELNLIIFCYLLFFSGLTWLTYIFTYSLSSLYLYYSLYSPFFPKQTISSLRPGPGSSL